MATTTPKYIELSEALREQIQQGSYRPGSRIPTEQSLMRTHGVSRSTVRQAVALLEKGKYVIRRRGAGTFVTPRAAVNGTIQPLKSLVFLVVDSPLPGHQYNIAQTVAAERWLGERGVAMTIGNLVTADLVKGRRPAVLWQGHCQGVLLDGWVTDMHCLVAEELDLPYVVVGNHPVARHIPQVRLDSARMMQRIIKYLDAIRPNQPIALLADALRLHITGELVTEYARLIQQRPQRQPLLQLGDNVASGDAVERLLEFMDSPFAIVTTQAQLSGIAGAYRRHRLDPGKYPLVVIAAIGNGNPIAPEDRALCHLLPHTADEQVVATLSAFVAAYEEGTSDSIYVARDDFLIEPPV